MFGDVSVSMVFFFFFFGVLLCHNHTLLDFSTQLVLSENSGTKRKGGERKNMGVSAVYAHTDSHTQLTAVELVRVGVLGGLLVRSIGVGVGDAAGLAELAGARHVQDVDEEGRGGGGQDEAVL